MGRDGLKAGVQIRKFVIITTRLCYRSVCNHPFFVGILLFLLFLYRSFPFLFSLLVLASPVLVCTAVLLGTLLSFGEPISVLASEEEAKTSNEVAQLKTGRLENTIVVEEEECFGRDSKYTELKREIVTITDEEPLLANVDKLDKSEIDHDDVAGSSMPIDHISREFRFEKEWIDEDKSEVGNTEVEQTLDLGDQLFKMGVGVGSSHGDIVQPSSSTQKAPENFEDYKSLEGSIDVRVRDYLVSSLELQKQLDEVLGDSLYLAQEVQHENYEDYISAEGSIDAQINDQLEPSLASWKQFDENDDRLAAPKEVRDERFQDYMLVEGSLEAQMRDHLESSTRSWKQFGSDHGNDDESDFGSDGAESSSPDASMADIIPMLDELHPLLEDENPQASNLSRQSSAVNMEMSAKSPDNSIHSDDESDKEEEADDGRSDADDDNEEEMEGGEGTPAESVITWTEDDQKNLMDLGTSELERNQRLESLIARRRARKMTGDRNLIDLDGMDLPFPVQPISTRRHNPFDFPQESYADLELPPIPGSAPSVMLARRNPFDLPYDSSEEKPDLTGDSFQQEFTELTQREQFNLREAIFRRNETFSMGSSGFDFGRPSRFRPYFVPERTDSDVMSYISLQRQLSELSESKASSAAETESIFVGVDEEEKKPSEHDSAQEAERISEIDQASIKHGRQSSEDLDSLSGEDKEKDEVHSVLEVELGRASYSPAVASNTSETVESADNTLDRASILVKHGSQSSEDLDSSSGEEKVKDFVLSVLEVELGRASNSAAAASKTSETVKAADNRHGYKENNPAVELWLSHSEVSHSDIQLMTEVVEVNHNLISSPLSAPKATDDVKVEDVDDLLVNREQSQVNNVLNVDIPIKYSLGPSVSDVAIGLSPETSRHASEAEVDDNHPKEPVYDLSPLKKNHSLSSSSDLQRETSGIDIYHLSTDLFVGEESNIHNQDVNNDSQHTKQDTDDNGLTVNNIGEGSERHITKLFSELNQLSGSPQSLIVAEDEGDLSMDDKGLKDTVLNDKVSPYEVEKICEEQDGAGVHRERTLDSNKSLEDLPSADEYEFAKDSALSQEKKEVVLEDDLFPIHSISSCSQVELTEDIGKKMEVNQQFQVPRSSLESHENEGNDKLLIPLDENRSHPHDSDIHDPLADLAEQERSIISRKLEEVEEVNTVGEPVNVPIAQEPQLEKMSDPGQSHAYSSQPEDSETVTIAELATKEHVQGILENKHAYIIEKDPEISEGFKESVDDEEIMNDERSDVKKIDEALLSELDAIGDFRMSDMLANLENSMIYPNNATDSDISAEAIGEVHSSIETSFGRDTLLGDSTYGGDLESEREIIGTNLLRNTESDLDSCIGNVDTDLLNIEARSIEELDAASKMVGEDGQNYVVAESVQDTFMREEVKPPFPETEVLSEDTESGGCAFEEAILSDAAALNNRELVPEKNQSDLVFLEGHSTDSGCRETVTQMSALDADFIEQFSEDVEKVQVEVGRSVSSEDLQTVAETGVGSVESRLLQLDSGSKVMEESSLVEASSSLALEPRIQTESTVSMEFESLRIDRDFKEISESSVHDASNSPAFVSGNGNESLEITVLGASIAPAVESEIRRERNTSEALLVERESREIQESLLVGAGIVSGVESRYHIAKFDSESMQSNEEVKETQELPDYEGSIAPAFESEDQRGRVGSSEPLQMDGDIYEVQESPAVEASIPSAHEQEKKVVRSEESKPLQRDTVTEDLQEWHVVEGTTLVEPEPLQTNTDIKEIQKSPTAEACVPVLESKDHILTGNSGEAEPLAMDRNIGDFKELPAVEVRTTHAVDSGCQLERVGVVESELLQRDGDLEEIQESPVLHTSSVSAVESKEQPEVN